MATLPDEQSDASNREDAKAAGLRWVSDSRPGIRRRRRGGSFAYIRSDGSAVPRGADLERIKKLAIPPAWTDVWICSDPRGHMQATGRDARGRKQYRYHERWREVRDSNKFDRMVAFGRALPRIRRRCSRDLGRSGLPRERVLAAIVRLLDESLIRVGNREYARDNKSFGLTTLRSRHVKVRGAEIRFSFRGKSGVEHSLGVSDMRVARVVRRLQDLPGQDVFQYVDEAGERRRIDSSDVNDYLQEISGSDFTAKDFRTWTATVLAAEALKEMQQFDGDAQAKRNVVAAIESVAARLGNTPVVCRKCYVHPAVTESYLDGTLLSTIEQRADEEIARIDRLGAAEAAVLVLLRHRLGRRRRRRSERAAA